MPRGEDSYHINFYDVLLKTPLLLGRRHQSLTLWSQHGQMRMVGLGICFMGRVLTRHAGSPGLLP